MPEGALDLILGVIGRQSAAAASGVVAEGDEDPGAAIGDEADSSDGRGDSDSDDDDGSGGGAAAEDEPSQLRTLRRLLLSVARLAEGAGLLPDSATPAIGDPAEEQRGTWRRTWMRQLREGEGLDHIRDATRALAFLLVDASPVGSTWIDALSQQRTAAQLALFVRPSALTPSLTQRW